MNKIMLFVLLGLSVVEYSSAQLSLKEYSMAGIEMGTKSKKSAYTARKDAFDLPDTFVKLSDHRTHRFEIIVSKKDRNQGPDLPKKVRLQEEAFQNGEVRLFYYSGSPDPKDYYEIVEIAPDIYAQMYSDIVYNHGPYLKAKRTVTDLLAENTELLSEWSIYKAQQAVDRIFNRLKFPPPSPLEDYQEISADGM